jgi:hypothetical protein
MSNRQIAGLRLVGGEMNTELVELALKREIARLNQEIKDSAVDQARKRELRAILVKRESQLERYQQEGRL